MSQNDDDDDPRGASAEKAAAFERRAAALRANLKRRKAQLRGRASDPAASAASAEPSDPIESP